MEDRFQTAMRRPMPALASSANDMLWVSYRWMSVGLAITGVVAMLVAASPGAVAALISNPVLFYGMMFAQLGMVIAFNPVAARASTAVAAAMFLVYSALTGVTFSTLFLVYTRESIASTFFITAGTFAGLSVYGATTKRDLSPIGRFLMFAVIGLVIASLVNMFVASSALFWLTTFGGVLIFAALTAYDTQMLKELFASGQGGRNLALVGALKLYLDFINMFLFLLRLFGRRD
jgi:FtsH-binding integral membrane protein